MDPTPSDLVPASFSPAEREAGRRVMRDRRDVRRFRPTPVPDDVLCRILEMAHLAPSVGFMQPWNFIVIADAELRRRVKALFEEVNARERARIDDPARRDFYARLTLEG